MKIYFFFILIIIVLLLSICINKSKTVYVTENFNLKEDVLSGQVLSDKIKSIENQIQQRDSNYTNNNTNLNSSCKKKKKKYNNTNQSINRN